MAVIPEELAHKHCVPCEVGTPRIQGQQLMEMLEKLPDWQAADEHHLTRTFKFPNFTAALEFVNRVGRVAEEENHHPLIHLTWGRVVIDLWTHKIGGLSENDFILAAKISAVARS